MENEETVTHALFIPHTLSPSLTGERAWELKRVSLTNVDCSAVRNEMARMHRPEPKQAESGGVCEGDDY